MRLANGPGLHGTSSRQPSTLPDSPRAHDLRQELTTPLDRVLTRRPRHAVFLAVDSARLPLARPPTSEVVAYIDAHKERFGVEPICRVLTEHGCKIECAQADSSGRRNKADS